MAETDNKMHFFISNLKLQSEEKMKTEKPELATGEIKMISFVVEKDERIKHIVEFEKWKEEQYLPDKEKAEMEALIQMNIHETMIGENMFNKPCSSVFIVIDIAESKIKIRWNFTDKTNKSMVF